MSTPIIARNKYDDLYPKIPNFEGLNNKLPSITNTLIVTLSGVLISILLKDNLSPKVSHLINTDNIDLASKVIWYASVGVLLPKAILMAGAAFQRAIFQKSGAGILDTSHRTHWGMLEPPRNPELLYHRENYWKLYDKIEGSFPETNDIIPLKAIGRSNELDVIKPETYSYDQLEQECEKLMESSLQIANAVRDDLKYWTETGSFIRQGKCIKGAALLIRQPGGSPVPNHAPWLYRGFFDLPRAYRTIFNLDECTAGLKGLKDLWGDGQDGSTIISLANAFEEKYPVSNKEALEGWKALFFKPGTKQFAWREQYNKVMKEIIDFAGGPDAISDTRFPKWGALHQENVEFKRRPTSMPT